jgi:hypothetical protein
MEELASFGYVCVACDFPYDATLVVYPDDEKAEFLFMEIPDNVTPTQVTSSCRPGAGPELQGGLGDCDHPVLAWAVRYQKETFTTALAQQPQRDAVWVAAPEL